MLSRIQAQKRSFEVEGHRTSFIGTIFQLLSISQNNNGFIFSSIFSSTNEDTSWGIIFVFHSLCFNSKTVDGNG
jgi:hypothetical protein